MVTMISYHWESLYFTGTALLRIFLLYVSVCISRVVMRKLWYLLFFQPTLLYVLKLRSMITMRVGITFITLRLRMAQGFLGNNIDVLWPLHHAKVTTHTTLMRERKSNNQVMQETLHYTQVVEEGHEALIVCVSVLCSLPSMETTPSSWLNY